MKSQKSKISAHCGSASGGKSQKLLLLVDNLKFKIFLFLVSCILFLFPYFVSASTFSFFPSKVSIKEGQRFSMSVFLEPQGVKNYTVKMELKYPQDLLEIKSFSMANGWVPLIQPGYDLIDNTMGILVKTGGYPGGVSQTTSYGSVSFYAKKSGSGIIQLSGNSLIFDANSKNVLTEPPHISIDISPKKKVKDKIKDEPKTEGKVLLGKTDKEALISKPKLKPEIKVNTATTATKTTLASHSQKPVDNYQQQPKNLLALISGFAIKETRTLLYIAILFFIIILSLLINRYKKHR